MNRLIIGAGAAVMLSVGSAAFMVQEGAPVAAPAGSARVAANQLSLRVDLSDRQLHVLQGAETIGSYPVAIGTPDYPTPRGGFSIKRLVWNPRWVPPDSKWARNKKAREPGDPRNPMGKVKIFFKEPDYYIHGTREVDSLGQAESHGCLRMANPDVIALAKQVMAHGGKPMPNSWFSRVINRVRSTHEVRLSTPVRVTVEA